MSKSSDWINKLNIDNKLICIRDFYDSENDTTYFKKGLVYQIYDIYRDSVGVKTNNPNNSWIRFAKYKDNIHRHFSGHISYYFRLSVRDKINNYLNM